MGRGDVAATLAGYLRAGYPWLGLQTHEEGRALTLLDAASREVGRALVPLTVTAARRANPDASALSLVEGLRQRDDAAVFALFDVHPWLADPLVVRSLRDLRGRLEKHLQTVVLVSPEVPVPAEISAEMVVLDVPLPAADELAAVLDEEAARAGAALEPELRARAVRALQGLTGRAARRAYRRALQDDEGLAAGSVADLVAEKRRILRRTDLLDFVDTPPALDRVGGLDALKGWLAEREAAFGEAARAFGLPQPKGLLLVGVQGCGKSLTAKAVARLWGLPLARLDFGALFTFGASPEANLRRVLRLAEALAPVVLWMDEIDKAFQAVERDGGSEELHRLFATFITWLQEKTAPAFVVATANAVDRLPPELLRKGRFDEIFFVDLPTDAERAEILRIHVAAHGRDPAAFDLAALAAATEHFSGAELEQVVIAGLYRAFRAGRDLGDEDLEAAARATVPLYRTYEASIKALREWARARARRASADAKLSELWGDRLGG